MKKTISKYGYFLLAALLLACQENKDPKPDDGIIADDPAARAAFFATTASEKKWKVSQLTFAAPTVVAELSEDPMHIDSTMITDLYAALPACRKDDSYDFNYANGNVSIDFTDQYDNDDERCDAQEPSFIEEGLFLSFNDELTTAQAAFRNNDALHQFLGFKGSLTGSGYLGYAMEWRMQSLSPDSVNIQGIFKQRDLPDLFIQFVPLE